MILQIGDSINKNFEESNFYHSVISKIENDEAPIWGINSNNCKHVLAKALNTKETIFILFKSSVKHTGKIIGLAVVSSIQDRILGPLFNLSSTNQENHWETNIYGYSNWDKEVLFKQYYDLRSLNFENDVICRKLGIGKFGQGSVITKYRNHPYFVEIIEGITKFREPTYGEMNV